MIAQESPRAWRRRGQSEGKETTSIIVDRFPRCNLHGSRIVSSFPNGCPCGVPDAHERLAEVLRRGWAQLADSSTQDHRGGLTLLDVADTCASCVGRLLRHRHVRFLRERIGCRG